MKIRVAGAQIPVTTDIESNAALIKRAIDSGRDEEADIVLTPEGSLSGYTHQFDYQTVEDALRSVVDYASESHIGLALGTCFHNNTSNKGNYDATNPISLKVVSQVKDDNDPKTFARPS